jgi:serine/threonine protein kinase
MDERHPKKLGRFVLMATGGMAEIYLSRQKGIEGFEKLLVVKRILPHLAMEKRFVDMFLDEARLAARLNHPNIVQIYDLGKHGSDYFIAMEYLEGESLGYLIAEANKTRYTLPPELAAGIVLEVCKALEYAHNLRDVTGKPLKIVHRDVSPHNIIVLFTGGVKLVDFGIAKATSQVHHTRPGTLKGKLSYISPEQCLGGSTDARTDIFSLGVIFWELLAGRRLYKYAAEGAIIRAILDRPVPGIKQTKPGVPEELEAVAMRALKKDPADRFQSAKEMGDTIQAYLRKVGAAAGTQEIGAFVNVVLAKRAEEKEKLLHRIRTKGVENVSLDALKPDTGESFPSKEPSSAPPAEVKLEDVPDLYEGIVDTEPVPQVPHDQSTRRLKKPVAWNVALRVKNRALLSALAIVFAFVLIVVALLWLTSGERPAEGALERPGMELVDPNGMGIGGLELGVGSSMGEQRARPAGDASRAVAVAPKIGPRVAPEPETGRKPRPKPQPRPRPTLLEIRSRPSGCRAKLDGKEAPGRTPLRDLRLEPEKEHVVAVFCKGHRKEVKRFAGGPGERITLSFAPPTRKLPPKAGTLNVNTEPWSEIFLGGKKLGMTPVLGVKLPPGKYILTAANDGLNIRKKIKITIRPGKATELFVNLKE